MTTIHTCIYTCACIILIPQSNAQYQASLRDQMSYQQQRVQQEAAQMSKELYMSAREEALYQERLRTALAQQHLDKTHPRRLMAIRK